jgi:hypothetical protein
MFGFTHEEIGNRLTPYVSKIAKSMKIEVNTLLAKMNEYYDGYAFGSEKTVYNPISVLSFLVDKAFDDYWIQTGDQHFIAEYMASKDINIEDFDRSTFKVRKKDIESPGEITNNLAPTLYLYQAGYLTPRKQKSTGTYYLSYPNFEVRIAMHRLINFDFFESEEERESVVNSLERSLVKDDYVGILATLNRIFSGEKTEQYRGINSGKESEREAAYKSIMTTYLRVEKFQTDVDIPSRIGQSDIVIKLPKKTFVFELKVAKSGTPYNINKKLKDAVDQMVGKDYLGAYKNAIPISLSIDGTRRCIALAAVGKNVYKLVLQKHDTVPPTFELLSEDLEIFLANISAEIARKKRKK